MGSHLLVFRHRSISATKRACCAGVHTPGTFEMGYGAILGSISIAKGRAPEITSLIFSAALKELMVAYVANERAFAMRDGRSFTVSASLADYYRPHMSFRARASTLRQNPFEAASTTQLHQANPQPSRVAFIETKETETSEIEWTAQPGRP